MAENTNFFAFFAFSFCNFFAHSEEWYFAAPVQYSTCHPAFDFVYAEYFV